MLTIHQLQVFVTVANHLSMRAAAEELSVSQPAVSASIASLNREVGTELFAKQGRGIELTPAGATLLNYSRRLLDLLDEALRATLSQDAGEMATVRLGSTSSAAAHLVMPWLATLREERPGLDFRLEIANRSTTWRMLAERSIDVALTSRPPTTATFTVLATRPNEFVLVARPGLVWAGQLGDATWLIREEGSTTRAATEEVLARLDLSPPHLVVNTNSAIQSSAEAGLGLALLPAAAVADAVRDRTLITIHTEATPLPLPWHVVVRAGEEPSESIRSFVTDLVRLDPELSLTREGEQLTGARVG